MLRWLTVRLAWMAVTLFGITAVTFALLDVAPVDRAQLAVARQQQDGSFANLAKRDRAIVEARIRFGMIDERTLEPAPLWRRYVNWAGNALTFRFAGPREDDAAFWRRLGEALPVSLLLGFLSLTLTFVIAVPLGSWLGMRAGSRVDRAVGAALFVVVGVPEFLLATLLLLGFAGAWMAWFPSTGLTSHGAESWSVPLRMLDLAWHLCLPVLVMASAPTVMVTRFLRDSVARAAASPFAENLRALGTDPAVLRRRLLHNGAAPLATLLGSLLPMVFAGSIIVETLFSLDGLGLLAFRAASEQDQPLVMALVLLSSIVTLLALIASDLAHRVVDPRVRLQR